MNNLYTIGEVSRIMGVSTQTLRYYSSIGLLKPAHINPDTGYRYYSDEQFHFIDRIRYLQKLGMSLEQIREILVNNDIPSLIKHLELLENDCRRSIEELNDKLDTIRWYRDYFSNSEQGTNSQALSYVKHFPRRYMVAVSIKNGESRESYHLRLTALRNRPQMQNLPYMRQYSIIVDYDELLLMKLRPLCLGMFVKAPESGASLNPFVNENILEIPEGDYFCFRSRILSDGWNPYLVRMFFSKDHKKPHLVLANEYEDSLTEYHSCPYEVQILIED